MELTNKQIEGLKIAVNRYKAKEKYTVIAGYAGTGKSTLVRFLIEELKSLGVSEQNVCYACFTGKAAQVLLKKGNKNVYTLHKLLYTSKPTADGKFIHIPKLTLDYDIVVVDEVSMAPKSIMELLFSHKVHVICLGDNFQLPPVNPQEDNHLLDNPHIFLDEIMRQEAESEIIQLTMKIRNREPIVNMDGKEVKILNKEDLSTGMLKWADQILVATNNKKNFINNVVRNQFGREGEPCEGDKVICTHNYWDNFDLSGATPLINGTIGYLNDVFFTTTPIPKWIKCNKSNIDIVCGNVISETGEYFNNLQMDMQQIMTGERCLDPKTEYLLRKSSVVPMSFEYGYAITTHKAQGSSWPNVLVIEERFPFDREEHARWLYTSCTRAENRLVLIR